MKKKGTIIEPHAAGKERQINLLPESQKTESKYTSISDLTITKELPKQIENYSELLDAHGFSYTIAFPYLKVEIPRQTQGWILHVSVIPKDCLRLLKDILPVLMDFRTSFKIVQSQSELRKFNNGIYGNNKVGKAVTIFVEDSLDLPKFLKCLATKTERYVGPAIHTDYRLYRNIYYRYGSFRPLVKTDGYENKWRGMLDGQGHWIEEKYSDPPFLPSWMPNPFLPFHQDKVASPEVERFYKTYQVRKKIKSDKKGDVFKGIYYAKGIFPTWCVIKQGRIGIFSDNQGLDIRDRLIWQYQIVRNLEGKISAPRMLDRVQDEDHVLVAMSYVHGAPLNKKCFDILRNRPWCLLDRKEKRRILNYLRQVVHQVDILHRHGYVHRDITGTNFIVHQGATVYCIDLELAYLVPSKYPAEPFSNGTRGYMSPNQQGASIPQYADDVYSLGALFVTCLTGIEPFLLAGHTPGLSKDRLQFFFQDLELAEFVASLLFENETQRPSMTQILAFLGSYSPQGVRQPSYEPPGYAIQKCVADTIVALGENQMTTGGLWHTHIDNPYDWEIYPGFDRTTRWNLYNGVGGPLYVLAKAALAGVDVSPAVGNIHRALQYISSEALPRLEALSPGLCYGASGLAITLKMSAQAGFLPGVNVYSDAIRRCFGKTNTRLDIINGIAGDGLSLLQCRDWFSQGEAEVRLNAIAEQLINAQVPNGSWGSAQGPKPEEKVTGFGYGIAGILYFLLCYHEAFGHQGAMKAAAKGLSYLDRIARKEKGHLSWPNSDHDPKTGLWWCRGNTGIALAFLKGYSITGEQHFKELVERALAIHPPFPVSHQISQCHGITGIAETYIECYRITREQRWLDRAVWIAHQLMAQQVCHAEQAYWLIDPCPIPTSALMTGNSGILHLLLRIQFPDHLSYPLLQT